MMVGVQDGLHPANADLTEMIEHCAAAKIDQNGLAIVHQGIDITRILKIKKIFGYLHPLLCSPEMIQFFWSIHELLIPIINPFPGFL
jgi:hypothetical protein